MTGPANPWGPPAGGRPGGSSSGGFPSTGGFPSPGGFPSTGGFPAPPASTGGFPPVDPTSGGSSPWGGTPAGAPAERVRPPLALLGAALLAPLVTLPLLFLDGWGWHVLGWAVATFGAAALLIVATLSDTRRRASAWYLGRDGLVRTLRLGTVVLALLAAGAHAWLFADWFSRLEVFA